MALDHYVSQVYLRNFYSPALDNQMYAIRKSDLKSFPCNSRSVCRIEEGSTNAYLINDRAIEDFLLSVEPKFNASLAKLRKNKIDNESIRHRPDRAIIRDEWIEQAIRAPVRETVQVDGRIRRWVQIVEMENRFLRVVLLPDGETVHNAFFDRRYVP